MENIPWRFGYYNIGIPLRVFMFVTIGLSVLVMIWGLVRRYRLWRSGQPQIALDRPLARLGRATHAVAQLRILRQRYPAAMAPASSGRWCCSSSARSSPRWMPTSSSCSSMPSCSRAASICSTRSPTWPRCSASSGLGMAAYRRYIQRAPWLNIDWRFNTTLPLAFILLSGLVVEALRLAIQRARMGDLLGHRLPHQPPVPRRRGAGPGAPRTRCCGRSTSSRWPASLWCLSRGPTRPTSSLLFNVFKPALPQQGRRRSRFPT